MEKQEFPADVSLFTAFLLGFSCAKAYFAFVHLYLYLALFSFIFMEAVMRRT